MAKLTFVIMMVIILSPRIVGATTIRDSYTFISTINSLYFVNHEIFPLEIIRPMCWDNVRGWCDPQFEGGYSHETWIVIDWDQGLIGSVRSIGDECFYWSYVEDYGEDNQPHIVDHVWVECPE